MTAYAIVSLRLRDTGWMHDYAANVPAIVARHGGEYLAASKHVFAIEGVTAAPDRMAIIRYPSIDALRACLADPDYQPYHESRIGPCDTEIVAFEA